jgi:nicotinamide riboside kinase
MRISLSGTFSTGKSTLAESTHSALTARYPGRVDLIREVARGVIAKGFQLDRGATVGSYVNYILAQLRAERLATAPHVISDRSLLDLIPYIRLNADENIPAYFTEMLEEVVWRESQYFDLYCYLPIEFAMEADEIRPADEGYRASVDRAFLQALGDFGVDYVEVGGTVAERTARVVDLFGG